MGVHGQSVDESDYDVLNVDILLELSTRLKEGIECLKVKFIWKHLESERERERESCKISLVDTERKTMRNPFVIYTQ